MEVFIQRYAKLSANWGMPLTAARVLAYLLLMPKPVSLDQIAEGMGISKAGAWGATKHLEQVNQIERFGEAGSKRALFAPVQDYARSLFNYSRMMRKSSDLMREAASVAIAPAASRRLRERSKFYLAVHEAIENAVEEFKAERRRAASE